MIDLCSACGEQGNNCSRYNGQLLCDVCIDALEECRSDDEFSDEEQSHDSESFK